MTRGPRFLKNPTIQFEWHEGKPLSAYIRLQDVRRKATRTSQPRAKYPIFLYLDADGFPVGVQMYAPIPGNVMVKLVDEFFTDGDGRPGGITTRVECDYVPTADARALICKVLTTTSKQLAVAGS